MKECFNIIFLDTSSFKDAAAVFNANITNTANNNSYP